MGIKPILILRQIVARHLRRATKNPIAGLTFYQILVTGGRLEQSLRPSTSLDHAPRRIQASLHRINSLVPIARTTTKCQGSAVRSRYALLGSLEIAAIVGNPVIVFEVTLVITWR